VFLRSPQKREGGPIKRSEEQMKSHERDREGAFFFLLLGLLFDHEDGGSTGLRNVCEPILDYTATHPR
jgi:hypothetical protein